MKSRYDFGTDEQYVEYLRHYYAGQALNGLITNPNINRPSIYNEKECSEFSRVCVQYSESLIKQLKINEK